MRLFACQGCGQTLYFANTRCERCRRPVGFLPESLLVSALEADADGMWRPLAEPDRRHRSCANAEHGACNWLVPAESAEPFCRACRHNRTIPNLDAPLRLMLWQRIEAAKHYLFYALLRLGLPTVSRREDPGEGLAFDFLAGSGLDRRAGASVATGHERGVIAIDLAEADDAERERTRRDMAEPYRTLLGHLRHEIGHYYWSRLVRDGFWLDAFRETFGDERRDYAGALRAHYESGPPPDWRERHVSAYASAHPWEDFAESWAHYLLIVDTLETASSFGLSIAARPGGAGSGAISVDRDPYAAAAFDALIEDWEPFTAAINSLARSTGQHDMYPFVLSPTVMGKLRFVHGLVHPGATPGETAGSITP